jgi:hypothetical protein
MHPPDEDVHERRLRIRLGLLNGLSIGLALALGVWALDAVFLLTAPVRLGSPILILGALAVVLLGGLGGWLAAQVGRSWAGGLIWLVVGWLMVTVVGHVPYEGRTLLVWVADRRSWGLPVYAFSEAAQVGMWLSGFFILLLLGLLGFLQAYRLEGIAGEAEAGIRLGGRGWWLLALPLPLVLAVGLIADNMVNSPLRTAPRLVNEVIRIGRTYPGDLFALSRQEGVNYNAIAGLRDQMSDKYTLSLGSIDLGASETVYVVADFDNYAWINCRVVMDHVASCYDASLPYFQGFSALLTSGAIPEDCPQCYFRTDDEQREWLQARRGVIGDSPQVGRLAQWGSFVLMQAESSDGEYVMQCLFEGASPVILQRCWEVKTRVVGANEVAELAAPTQSELEPPWPAGHVRSTHHGGAGPLRLLPELHGLPWRRRAGPGSLAGRVTRGGPGLLAVPVPCRQSPPRGISVSPVRAAHHRPRDADPVWDRGRTARIPSHADALASARPPVGRGLLADHGLPGPGPWYRTGHGDPNAPAGGRAEPALLSW